MMTQRKRHHSEKGMPRSCGRKQQESDSYRGDNELADERRSVNQQGMRTPGRRGEEIKQEELDKEFVRRSKGK
jgi:hypothetical protein